MNLQGIIQLILLNLIYLKAYSFNCTDILDENLCLDSPGCQFTNQICSGQIQTTCNPPQCIYVDPQNTQQGSNGTILNPFSNLKQAILYDGGEKFIIQGLKRQQNTMFEILVEESLQFGLEFTQSFTLQPYQANAATLHIELRFQKYLLYIENMNVNIEVTIKQCTFHSKNKVDNSIFFLHTRTNSSIVNIIDSYFIQQKGFQSMPMYTIFPRTQAKLKYVNMSGSLSDIILYDLQQNDLNSLLELEFVNCYFKGGILYWQMLDGKGQLKFLNVTFDGVDFTQSWRHKISTVIFENVKFYNLYTRYNFAESVFYLNTQTIILQNVIAKNLTIKNKSFIKTYKSPNININNLIMEEVAIGGSIFSFINSIARFNRIHFQKISSLTNINYGPLCIYASILSNIIITNSIFQNITSQCIAVNQSNLNLIGSHFSNENLGAFLQTLTISNSENQVTWIHSTFSVEIIVMQCYFETNYLPAKEGAVLRAQNGAIVAMYFNNIMNQTAYTGSSIYATGTTYSVFSMKQNTYKNLRSIKSGGVYTIRQAGKHEFGHLDSTQETFINCTSNHSGGILFIKGIRLNFVPKQTIDVLPDDKYIFDLSETGNLVFNDVKLNIINNTTGKLVRFLPPFYDQDFQRNLNSTTLSSPQINKNTIEMKRPKTFKVYIYALNKWQVQIQNEKYYEEAMKNIASNNISQYEIRHITHLDLTDQIQKLNVTLELKSGHRLPYIIMVEVFDQFDEPFTDDIQNDELMVELKDSNSQIPNNPQDRFSMNGINSQKFSKNGVAYISLQNTYFAQIGSQKVLNIKSKAQSYGIFEHIFQSIDFEINLKFKECEIGDIQQNSTQICDTCPQDLYSWGNPLDKLSSCQRCIDGMECLGSSIVVPKAQHWKYSQFSTKSIQCPYPDDCLGGAFLQNNIEPDFKGECKFPSRGNLCNQCASGFIRSHPQTPCIDCAKDVGNYILFGVMFIGQILLIVVVTLTTIRSNINKTMRTQKAKEINNQQFVQARKTMEKHLFSISQLIKNAFNYFETIRIIYQFSHDQIPLFATLLSGISYIIPSQDTTFSIDCFIELMTPKKENHFWIKYIAILFKPILIFIIIFLITAILNKFNKQKIQTNPNWGSFKLNRAYILTMIIVIIYFNQPHIIVASLSLLNCQNINTQEDPKYYLSSDSGIECWEGNHKVIVFSLALPMLIIWGILIPIIALKKLRHQYKLRKDKEKQIKTGLNLDNFSKFSNQVSQQIEKEVNNVQNDESIKKSTNDEQKLKDQSLSFLIYNVLVRGSIKEDFYYWELVTTFRKFLLMLCFITLKNFDFVESLIFSTTIIIVLGIIHLLKNPYNFKSLNTLDSIGYISIYLLLMALICLKGSESQSKVTYYIFNITFLILTLIFIVLMLVGLGSSLLAIRKTQKQLSKLNNLNNQFRNSSEPDNFKLNTQTLNQNFSTNDKNNNSFEGFIIEKNITIGKSNFALTERKDSSNSGEGIEESKEPEIEKKDELIMPPLIARQHKSYLHNFCGVEKESDYSSSPVNEPIKEEDNVKELQEATDEKNEKTEQLQKSSLYSSVQLDLKIESSSSESGSNSIVEIDSKQFRKSDSLHEDKEGKYMDDEALDSQGK